MLILIILIVFIFPVHECLLASVMSDSATVWTIARQTPLSMGFCRQEYQSELPCPPPRDLPKLVIKLASFLSPVFVGRFTTSSTWEVLVLCCA